MIEVESLSKTYQLPRGRAVRALDDVTFSSRPGEILGLLGANGAGKTTALRIIATAIQPTTGTARVAGHDVVAHPREVRRAIGFLSSNTGLYGRLTPREVLAYFGRLFGMHRQDIAARTETLAGRFAMRDFLDRPCDRLSTGMRQKVNIARTVLHDPRVIVFDEPTAGLDVLAAQAIVTFLADSRDAGHTVLFSTHVLSEVERLADRVAVIHGGKLKFCGTPAEMLAAHERPTLEEAFVKLAAADLEANA